MTKLMLRHRVSGLRALLPEKYLSLFPGQYEIVPDVQEVCIPCGQKQPDAESVPAAKPKRSRKKRVTEPAPTTEDAI